MQKIFALLVIFSFMSTAQTYFRDDRVFSPDGVLVQDFTAPFFADLDHDDDADLILGSIGDRVEYFECVQLLPYPKYRRDTTVFSSIYANGLVGTNADYPFLADFDADQDLDLVIGGYNGLIYYENTGTPLTPVWQKLDSIFTQVNSLIGTDPKPVFADMDADGDLDLYVGIGESLFGGPTPGTVMSFRNNGTQVEPAFELYNSFAAGIPDVGLNAYPTLADMDSDGDNDMLIGRDLQTFYYFRNNGSVTAPSWTRVTSMFNTMETTTYWKNPTLFDIDKDGDYDLVYGTDNGRLYTYINTGTQTVPAYSINTNYFRLTKLDGGSATVSFGDFDNDGDKDIISGSWDGKFYYFKNVGTPSSPYFQPATALFSSLDAGSYSSPVFIDIDSDRDLDIVSGNLTGTISCFINNGNAFINNTSYFGHINVAGFSIPTFADLDADGDFDLLVGAENSGNWKFYKNNGQNVFELNTEMFSGVQFFSYARPTLADIDKDLDYDLIIGRSFGEVVCYRNIGTIYSPSWMRDDTPFSGVEVKQNAHPGFADLSGDGYEDIVIGEYDGNFTYFNYGAPLFISENEREILSGHILLENYPNPFNSHTTLRITLFETVNIIVEVFNTAGMRVMELSHGIREKGTHTLQLDMNTFASGIYFVRLKTNLGNVLRKILLLK